jgi:hypothetical protein
MMEEAQGKVSPGNKIRRRGNKERKWKWEKREGAQSIMSTIPDQGLRVAWTPQKY